MLLMQGLMFQLSRSRCLWRLSQSISDFSWTVQQIYIIHYMLCIICYTWYLLGYVVYVTHYILCIMHYAFYIIYHYTWYIIHYISWIIDHTSYIIHCTLYKIIYYTSTSTSRCRYTYCICMHIHPANVFTSRKNVSKWLLCLLVFNFFHTKKH